MNSSMIMIFATTIMAGVLFFAGCNQGEIEQVVKGVTDDVSQTTSGSSLQNRKPKAAPNRNGKATIKLDTEVKFDASYISLMDLQDRGVALHVRSYAIGDEGVPSYFMQANVSESSIDRLVGKDVKARVFARTGNKGGVWSNVDGELATLKIEKKGELYLVKMELAELFHSENGSQIMASGEMECVVTDY